ncbi:MAG: hypothetical protein LBI81_02535 [Puniceicoccales bacterium]|nr:hypothetical protein [Puniceicoccales bacterium]
MSDFCYSSREGWKVVNKVLEVLQGGISQSATKNELKQLLKKGMEGIDAAQKFLQSADPDQFVDFVSKSVRSSAKRACDDGSLSKESIENMRKMALIYPSKLSDKLYELSKTMYELGKQMQTEKE